VSGRHHHVPCPVQVGRIMCPSLVTTCGRSQHLRCRRRLRPPECTRGRAAVPGLLASTSGRGRTVALLLVAVLVPDLAQFQGKAFAARAVAYPIALAIVRGVWLLLRRPIPSA
jgi:hypothetical protein